MAGPVGSCHHLVEELHLPCEVWMIGVAQCGQRGLLGLALGFGGPGLFPGVARSLDESAGLMLHRPRRQRQTPCRWRSAPARPVRTAGVDQSAVPVELLLDRLFVFVQRRQKASTEERSRCWSPDFRKAEALRTLSGWSRSRLSRREQ